MSLSVQTGQSTLKLLLKSWQWTIAKRECPNKYQVAYERPFFGVTVMTYTLTRVLRIIFWSHLQWFAFGRLWYNCLMLFLDVPFLNYWNQMVEMNIQHMPLFLHLVSLHCCEWKLTIIEFPSQNVWVHHAKHKYDLASKRSSKQTDVNKKYKPQVHSFIQSFIQSVSQSDSHS